jgi:hypothetical protein
MQEPARETAKGDLSKTPAKAGLEHRIGKEGVAGPRGTLKDLLQVLA